jgi:hypothetical protein
MGSITPLVAPSKFETCPDWGAKPFKYLGASTSAKTPLPLPSVGSFVGMLLHNAAQACILCGGPLDREGPEAVKLSSRPLEIAPPENVGEDDTRVYADSLNFIPAIGDTKTRRVVPPGPEIV